MKTVTENTRTVKANAALKATKDMGLVALFTLIMAVCSWISIPTAIPFTMQTFGVFLTISILGGKRGTMSICLLTAAVTNSGNPSTELWSVSATADNPV